MDSAVGTDSVGAQLRERTNLKDDAARYVRSQIFTGQMKPRHKIDQDLIAATLGISRQPVREAMIQLEGEALVKMVARRGAFVAALTREDIIDHFVIFGLVSGLSARRCVERMPPAELEHLLEVATAMEQTSDPSIQHEMNEEFHRILNRSSGSRRLNSVISLLGNSIPEGLLTRGHEWWASAVDDHRKITAAIQARDGEAASAAVEAHLRNAGLATVAALEARGFWEDRATVDDGEEARDVGAPARS